MAAPTGTAHHRWKGDNVKYGGLHDWIAKARTKTGRCSHCGEEKKTAWANVSGEYKRDIEDWIELCYRCHNRMDWTKRLTPEQLEMRDAPRICEMCGTEMYKSNEYSYKYWSTKRFCSIACRNLSRWWTQGAWGRVRN